MSEFDKRRERLEIEGTNEIMKKAQEESSKTKLMTALKMGIAPDPDKMIDEINDKEYFEGLIKNLEGDIQRNKEQLVYLMQLKTKAENKLKSL